MPAISIVNQKGGTGKTTTTLNLGAALAALKKSVLIVDMDSQGNLGYSLGLDDGKSLSDLIEGNSEVAEVIQVREGVSVIPSDMRLVDIELSLADLVDRHRVVLDRLAGSLEQFDYVLFDCPPSLSVLSVNALFASDYVIIPMLMEVLSLQGLDQIIASISKINSAYNKELSILGILPVMVDKRRKLTEEVRDHIRENYDVNIFDSYIRNNVKASESPSFGSSVIAYAPSSNSAKDYTLFAKEIVELI